MNDNVSVVHDPSTYRFRPLSSKASLPAPRARSSSKSGTVVPKQKGSPYKAKDKCPEGAASRRLLRATERRAKCMETSSKLTEYFSKSKGSSGSGVSDPVCLSSDDGSPTPTQTSRHHRRLEAAHRFLDCEAGHSGSDVTPGDSEEEGSPVGGGFIVSDGHLSSDEESDGGWSSIYAARRVSPRESWRSPPRGAKEAEKERDDSVANDWSPCGQPPSPPMSPVRIDEDTDVDLEMDSPSDKEDVVVEAPVEVDEPGEVVVEVPGKKFRLQNQYLLLTYKSHIPKSEYIEWFKGMFPGLKFIRLAHEAPDRDPLKCPYQHTHVVVDLGRRPNIFNVHKFCYKYPGVAVKLDKCGSIHCNIKRLYGSTALEDAKEYIGKEDRENADLKDLRVAKGARLVERIQSAPSQNIALKQNLKRLGDAAAIIAIYGCRPSMTPTVRIPDRPDKPWQVELLEEVEDKDCPPYHREIIWYVDYRGKTGKSWFSRYMSRAKQHEDGTFDWLCLSGINEDKEAAHQLKEAMDSGFTCKGFILDFARQFEFCEKFYKYIEDFKNGEVTSTKYRGGRLHFNTPWIIVFANFWPKVKKMSTDRWDIRKINVDTDVAEHLPFDAETPNEFPNQEPRMRYDLVQERV